jgi:hypothetical protein
VYYPSWLWISIEEEETTVNNNNRVYRNDWEYYEQMYRLVFVLFTAADKVNFNLVNSRGELPLHLVRLNEVLRATTVTDLKTS